MKLTKKQIILIGFMIFSLFFGAGNLIFPPFLGQNAGEYTPYAITFFCMSAVTLPILSVIVVVKMKGLDQLSQKVNSKFAFIYPIIISIAIGPGLAIPRAASLPFEMAVAPYLSENSSTELYMLLFSIIFFLVASWLASNPKELINRVAKCLVPTLLFLLVFVFLNFVFRGEKIIVEATEAYVTYPYVEGFLEGYMTMDAIAALIYGFVVVNTLNTFGIKEDKEVLSYTIKTGIIAGCLLAGVYLMLSYMGMCSSGVFSIQENGAWTLRCIVESLFGGTGAIILAAIFTIACLTTSVGLITSCSKYFSSLTKRIDYQKWVYIISLFSFVICNLGLTAILNISIPLLDAIYPISIVLIVLGLFNKYIDDNPYIYPFTIFTVGIVSVVYALENVGLSFNVISQLFHLLPLYSLGLGWVIVAIITALVSVIIYKFNLINKL